jgi:hypothetical protein
MENYLYTCQYCSKQYKPKRRKQQKYCSNSCRTRAFVLKKDKGLSIALKETPDDKLNKIEKMSLAGVGNAAVGTLAINLATRLFTKEEDKPVTKKDLQNLVSSMKLRYHPIYNLPFRRDGAEPFYDLETENIIYLFNNSSL